MGKSDTFWKCVPKCWSKERERSFVQEKHAACYGKNNPEIDCKMGADNTTSSSTSTTLIDDSEKN